MYGNNTANIKINATIGIKTYNNPTDALNDLILFSSVIYFTLKNDAIVPSITRTKPKIRQPINNFISEYPPTSAHPQLKADTIVINIPTNLSTFRKYNQSI
jgi:hypothetical protein